MSDAESDSECSQATSVDDASVAALPKTKQGYIKDDFVVSDSEDDGGDSAASASDAAQGPPGIGRGGGEGRRGGAKNLGDG